MTEDARLCWSKEGDGVDFINGGLDSLGGDTIRRLAESVARPGMIGFEIGCYTGWTASKVIPVFAANGGCYHCLDWFRGSVNTQVGLWNWGKAGKEGQFDSQRVLLQTLKNFEVQGWGEIVSVIVAQGSQVAPVIADGILDYVYIGADHRYSNLKRDIEDWWPKLRSGGILCGHAFTGDVEPGSEAWEKLCAEPEQDFYKSSGLHFGVTRAVRELLPGFNREGQMWWAVKELDHDRSSQRPIDNQD